MRMEALQGPQTVLGTSRAPENSCGGTGVRHGLPFSPRSQFLAPRPCSLEAWCICVTVRDRVRSKMERDILAEVNHPFIVKLHYGE